MRVSKSVLGVILLVPLVALAAVGDLLWSDQYNHAGWFDTANDVGIASRFAVVVGVVNDNAFFTAGDLFVRGYALRSGKLLWEEIYDRAGGYDEATSVAVADGVAFVGGYSSDDSFDTDLMVRAYRARNGRVLWEATYDGGPSDIARQVVTDGVGVYAAGQSDAGGPMDFLVVAFGADTGEQLWTDRHDFNGADDRATAVAQGGGRVFAVGTSEEAPLQSDGLVRAYDAATGTLLWQDRFDIAGDYDAATAVATGSGCAAAARRVVDCVHVAGTVTNAAGNSDFHVRTYDAASGELLWEDTYDPTGGYDSAGVVVADAGMVYVGGNGTRPRRLDGAIVRAYDGATGALAWESRRQSRTDGNGVKDLVVGSDRVYALGSGVKKEYSDYLVRSYDSATGDLQWEERFDLFRRSDQAAAGAYANKRLVTAGRGTPRGGAGRSYILVRAYKAR
jgi:glucose dehydrogenase